MDEKDRLNKKDVEDILPLTFLQEGILFHYLKNGKDNVYSIQLTIEVQGAVDKNYFQRAWSKVVEGNEMLRAVYRWEKLNKPVQVILKRHDVDIRHYDLSEGKGVLAERELQRIKQADYREGFDLTEVPFRIALCQLQADRYSLLISNHHIIYDGWSNGIILKEFLHHYEALVSGKAYNDIPKRSFKDYIRLSRVASSGSESFWGGYLTGYEFKSALSPKSHSSLPESPQNACCKFSIPEDTLSALKRICEAQRLTIADVLYGAWGILLSKYSGEVDVVFGTTVSGRSVKLDGVERMVGLFINTIPLRMEILPEMSLISAIKESASRASGRREFENTPLRSVLDHSGYKENELFESIFVIENYPLDSEILRSSSGLAFKSFTVKESTNYALTVSAFVSEGVELSLNYLCASFEPGFMEGIGRHYARIVDRIIDDSASDVFSLDLLSEAEKHQLLHEFNDTGAGYPKGKTVHQLFEEQAGRTPANTALLLEGKAMTYLELNERSNRLASALRDKGIQADSLVGLMVERSFEMVVGIIGILKAGGAYLPIDPEYPEGRKVFMLDNSRARLLLTSQELYGGIGWNGEVLFLGIDERYSNDTNNSPSISKPTDLAYVIYTSGTTGQPKGVMIEHRNVVRLMFNDKLQFDFNEDDVWTMFHSYCFDFSVWEMYGALLYGGKLIVIPRMIARDPLSYLQIIKDERVTILNQTPSAFYNLINEELDDEYNFWRVRNVIFGGEALSPMRLKGFRQKYPSAKLINMYGITETTVHVTFKEIGEHEIEHNISNIGKPIPTLTAYVLDRDRRLTPIGVPGELCVGGLGVARGYLHNPELTEARFIGNPYNLGERLYCSGDLARVMPGGDIEYLGRIDHQVKIRGFRIELGEIESSILLYPAVKECAVIPREDDAGDKYLCAYVAFRGEEKNPIPSLRSHLSGLLPDYMVPAYILRIDRIPLTGNGKIDRGSLPEPEIKAGLDYVAPSNAVESKLAEIWSAVLSVALEEISANASFFALGGHSLKVTILVSLIHKELDVRLELRDIFQHQTIQEQSTLISSAGTTSYLSIPVAKVREYYPLSSSQRRLYLLQRMDLNSVAYNMPGLINVPKDHTRKQIVETFKELINRHESLRTSFELVDGLPVQRIHPAVPFSVSEHRVEREALKKLREDLVRPFDLSQAPLLRVGYVDIQGGEACLLVDMHHIISDGRSHEILSEEFSRLLSGDKLPPLRLQYKDYSEWQSSEHQQERIKEQEKYWVAKLAGDLPVLDLPMDYTRPPVQSFSGASVQIALSPVETGIIRELCRELGLTQYMSLLSAFTILLSKLSGQDDIIVGTPVAARRHADLEGIAGMFVNTLAIRSQVSGVQPLRGYLLGLKESMLEAYENQEYQFEDLVERVSVNRDASRNPVFDVMFNLLNRKDDRGELTALSGQELIHAPGVSKFDLTLTVVDCGEQLLLTFEYCTRLFRPERIERYVEYFRRIAVLMRSELDQPISEVDLLSTAEKHQLLYAFNDTKADYPRDKTVAQLFEEQVGKTPDRIALIMRDHYITYKELHERSSQIAAYLQENISGSGEVIGLLYDRNIAMITAILAILKTGNAYLPIDSKYPKERIALLLKDCNVRLVLSQADYRGNIESNYKVVDIDEQAVCILGSSISPSKTNPSELVYIMFTSGSSGGPKGVLVENRSVVRLVKNQNYVVFDESDRVLQTGAPVFDATTFEIWGALLNGGSLLLVPQETIINSIKIADALSKNGISILWLTSALFNQLCEADETMFCKLKYLLVGGDILSPKHINKARRANKNLKIINGYGPTENTTFSTCFHVNHEFQQDIPIGSPIHNSSAYIMDPNRHLQPIGVIGELYVGGDGVSRGYLNNPELTKEKFIDHPFSQGEKLYRTGDLARWLPDGNIEFLGRIDHQVKLRGFRIELGEIESALLGHERIKESVVVAREADGDKCLCAYVVSDEEIDRDELCTYLSGRLPDYMIPSYYVQLEQLPLTSNGKIDRRSLPSPEYKAGSDYVAPSNYVEEQLAQIWSEVLNAPKEEISVTANFFSMGGHSLKATVLTGRIHRELGVEFPLREVFTCPTIRTQASRIALSDNKGFISIPKAKRQDYYPLSSAQKRMYLLQQMDLGSTAYNMPGLLRAPKGQSRQQVEELFRQLIQRHDSFRTSFEVVDEMPVQRIHGSIPFSVREYRIGREELPRVSEEFVQPFDLGRAPLLRVGYLEVLGGENLLLVDMHHTIGDGRSYTILSEEFKQLTEGNTLPPLALQYKDYSEWQNSPEQQRRIKSQERYWQERLIGELPVLSLPTDYARPRMQEFEGARVAFSLTSEETQALRGTCNDQGLTLYMSLLSIFTILLSRLSGQEDIIVGSPVAARRHTDLEGIVGMFVNTLALRNGVKGVSRLTDFLQEVKANTIEAYEHQEYQFEDLVEKISVNRDTSRNPIFDVMFNLLEEPPGEGAEPSGERFMHVPAVSKFDLSLTALDFGTALQLSVEYSTRLFRPESIERYIGYLRRIIAGVSAGTDRTISEVDMLSTEEKHQLLYAFNDTKADYPKGKTIHQLFEEQVERTPDSIALVFEDSRMTFFELNAKSNQLGRVLRGKGVIPDGIVGLLVDRGIETIIGALGILKAGGAYLPIDTDYPDARIDYILDNSNSDTVVTIRSKKQRVSDDKNVIYVEDSNLDSDDCSNLVRVNNTADLAYIIYTSGTTGKPKGVMIEHRNVVRLMFNDKFQFDFNSKDVWTMFHSHSFDFSVWEMYGSLLYGGKLVIIPKMIARSPSYYIQILRNECVTILNQTPSVFYGLADEELQFNNSALSLRNVIFGGEALTPNKLTRWREKYPNVKLINMFGITETTVHVTFKEIGSHEIEESVSNIGKPIPTLATYILDTNRKLVPVGVSGELCVGGLGVSRGYLNNPELTAERFIQNPYKPEERLYCSGDLARIFPDGDMEHLGRIDHQVQLRGFRIELGEIESALLGHERIKESVVIDREADGDKYLCAYVVSDGEIDRDELCTYLSGRLPDYMIPSYYVQLEQLPLTSNGKIDRRSLPSPEYKAGSGYEAPSNAIESTLVRIWSEVLNLPQEEISVTSNFFSMGGHSLKATVLTGRIHRELGVEFPLREVFTCPTIRTQASRIALSENKGFISIPKAKRQDYYSLSSAQKRMYLLQQMDLGSTAYNLPMIIRLSADADFDRITSIFNRLIARHESFRTSFELKDELPIQRIHSDVDFEIKVYTIEERDLEKRRTDFIRPFDLFHAPLLRAELLHIKAGDPVLLIDMHHIISDGESHGILVEEFNRLISGQDLPPLRMQYKDYSEWQNSKEHQESIQHQESYWIEKFTDELPVLTLPTDYPRPVVQDINGSSVSFLLSADETAIILDICKEQSLTLYMAMLSVFTILLSKLSGQEDIIVGSPIAARHHADLEGVVGIFVNTLAIRSDVSGHKRLADYLQEFKGKMIEVYENQDYQFEDLVEKVALDRDPSRNPIFDVMFNLQNRKESLGDLLNLFPNEYAHEKGVSKFDLSFIVKDFDQQLLVTIEYCTALFKPDTIDRFVQYFKHLVRQLPTGLSNQLHEIEILPPEEKDQILKKFNATEKNYPVTHVSHELFEQIAYQFPDRTAVVLDELHLTFSTLNQYANKVAKELISRDVQNNRMIAVIADRSLEMIINMIGVIKSGGAYLPLDIDYPIERLKEQLQDSGVEIILSSKNLIDGTIFNRDVLCVDFFNTSESDEDPKVNVRPNDLAYLIYTSGSTGVPKGVEVEHMSLVNMVLSLKERYRIGKNERILQFSSPSFDVSVEQIWLSLLSGSTLVLIRQELLHNIDKFESYVEAKGVTHLNVVPTYLSYLNADRKRNVRRVIVGGESLSVDLLKPWVRQSDFYNVYGTTETTVTCTSKYYQKGEELINKVSIGQPIDNSTVYIFDEHLHLLPIGVFGELFIGGSSLARGYHNKESLTNERFISNPFKPEERLYKTGDRVRWVGSGDIEFLDRIDDQVKVRGYRIELGEVEVNILRHSNVKEVAVATRKDEQGNNYLCAYYVSKTQAKNLAESIKDYLSGILPHYMVPSYFIEMDELPLTPSGKINRKGLPSPKINLHDGYIAPSNKVEETLVKIWSEVLNILPEEISVNASFFMLGGHSLKATVLVSRIHRELDVKLGLKEIFLHQTIEAMAALINASNNKAFIAIPKAEKKLYYKLSSAQKRLFFIQQLNPDNLAYNMPMLIEIPNEIGIAQVEEVCKVLISRHENFRTSYHIVNGEAVQRIYSELPFSVNECRIKEDELEGINEELIKPFNLGQAPLLRVFYLHVENKGPVLFFDMHHIISDGASLKILEKEFYQLLAGEKLHPISLQYKDYSEWQSNYEKQNVIKKQEEYWLDMFRGDLPVLNLPTDFPRKALQDFKGYAVEFILSKEETENVKMLSRKSDSTLYMTLLSVLAILLSKLCGQKDIVIGTPVFGRQHNDLEKIVGMFINILAIRYEVKNVKSLLEFVNDVKQNTIEAFDNQDYQFDDLVDKVLKERSLSRNPFFDVLFNLLNYKNFSGDLSQLNQEKGHQGLEASKLDLTLTAVDYGEQLFFSFKYSTSLFKEETIIQFVEYFRGIINQIPSKLNAPVSEIDLVDHKNEEDLENCLNMSLDQPGN